MFRKSVFLESTGFYYQTAMITVNFSIVDWYFTLIWYTQYNVSHWSVFIVMITKIFVSTTNSVFVSQNSTYFTPPPSPSVSSVGVFSKRVVQTGIFLVVIAWSPYKIPALWSLCFFDSSRKTTIKGIYELQCCSKHRGKINERIDSQVMSFAQVCVGACVRLCVSVCAGCCKCAAGLHKTGAINQHSSAKITQMGAFLAPLSLCTWAISKWGHWDVKHLR